MADINSLVGFLGDVANAIREKDGISGSIQPKDYDNRIRNLGSKVNNLYSFSFYNGKATSYDKDIQSINTASVQNLDNAFYNCTSLTDLNEFSMENIKTMKNILYNCVNLTNESLCNIANMLPLYSNITDSSKTDKLTYIGLTTNQILNIPADLQSLIESKGWSISFDPDHWTIAYNTTSSATMIYLTDDYSEATGRQLNKALNSIPSRLLKTLRIASNQTQNITDWSSLCSHINAQSRIPIENLNIPMNQVFTNIYSMFYNSGIVGEYPNLNISLCTNLSGFAYNTRNMYGPIPNWDTSNVVNFGSMFHSGNVSGTIPNWNTSKGKDFNYLFSTGKYLTGQLPNWDLSLALYTNHMFADCWNLTGNIPNYDLSNVLNAGGMFGACYNLTGNIPNFNFTKCTGIGEQYYTGIFQGCSKLTGSIPNWNTPNLKAATSAFRGCSNLTGSIPNWNIRNLVQMGYTFAGCSNLTGSIPSTWIFNSNMTNLQYTFSGCSNLTGSIPNLLSATPSQYLTNLSHMFANCEKITDFLGIWNLSNIRYLDSMFEGCNNLSNSAIINIVNSIVKGTNVTVKNLMTSNVNSPFYNTKFDNSYYTQYHSQLTAAGWTY